MTLRHFIPTAIALAAPISAFAQDIRIDFVVVDNSDLLANVMYGGGCKRHSFEFDVQPVFGGSERPQAKGEILHDANNDTCERAMRTTLKFDIGEFINDYRSLTQQDHGSFELDVKGYGLVEVTF